MMHLPTNLVWSVFKNVASQGGGKILISLARFAIAALIVRMLGLDRFGEYSIVLAFILLAEWLVDFGLTDIVVRELCAAPERKNQLLSTLMAAKLIQGLAGGLVLVVALAAMGYDEHVVRSGIIGAIGVLCYALVTAYRAAFKLQMCMERDVSAELMGVIVMIPLTWAACTTSARLEVLIACFAASRIIFLGIAALFARGRCEIDLAAASRHEMVATFRRAAPLGLAGLVVVSYNALDLVLLSRLGDTRSVGLFSAAIRFVWPVLIVVDAVSAAMFPLFASFWRKDMDRFEQTLQRLVDITVVLAVGGFCLFQSNGGLLMGLLGPETRDGGDLMRVLAIALIARSITSAFSPLVVVTHRQHYALWMVSAALIMKSVLLFWLVPIHGAMGVAYAWVATDVLAGVLPTVLISQRLVGLRVRWNVVWKAGVAAAVTLAGLYLAGLLDSWAGLFIVAGVYPCLVLVFRAVSIADLSSLRRGIADRLDRTPRGAGAEAGEPGA